MVRLLKRLWKSWINSDNPWKMIKIPKNGKNPHNTVKIMKRQGKSWKDGEIIKDSENLENKWNDGENPEKTVKILENSENCDIMEIHKSENLEKNMNILKICWRSLKYVEDSEKSVKNYDNPQKTVKILKRWWKSWKRW